jgi:radical SAM superfamily enzyme YgiQ (UPF0313 family)
MKILLIKPPQNPHLATNTLYEPLELEYIAASVRDSRVRILDMRIDRNLHRELIEFKPDLVGITAYTCDYNTTVQILKRIRLFDKTIITVVGGHHATFLPDDFVLPCVDAIFLGYGDFTFPQYVKAIGSPDKLKEIPNIAILVNGTAFFTKRIFSVPDLNQLPLPDRNLTAKYRRKYHDTARNRLSLIMTSRGCPYRCNFCACWKLMEGKYTARTPESIIDELKSLPEKIEVVYFSDDNTFNDIDRMWRLVDLIKRENIRKKLQMYARADTIVKNQSLFKELTGAGLRFVTVGLESFRNSDLEFFKKRVSVEINTKAIRVLKQMNAFVLAHFIIRPDYTKEDFRQLFSYVCENNLFRPSYPVLTPLPGTELYQRTRECFKIKNFDFFDFTHSILPTRLDTREFYRQLTNLYLKSFSIRRLLVHRLYRLLSLNKEKYFTDNTDGITIRRLILISFYSAVAWFKLRHSCTDLLRHPHFRRELSTSPVLSD